MNKERNSWKPVYAINSAIAQTLMKIEAAKAVVDNTPLSFFRGRERDVREVRNYWDALLRVKDWAANRMEFTEDLIMRLHAIIEKGEACQAYALS